LISLTVFHDEFLEGGFVGEILEVGDDEITIGERCIHSAKFLLEDIHSERVGDSSVPVGGGWKSFHVVLNFGNNLLVGGTTAFDPFN
jgi:hypothetical protein